MKLRFLLISAVLMLLFSASSHAQKTVPVKLKKGTYGNEYPGTGKTTYVLRIKKGQEIRVYCTSKSKNVTSVSLLVQDGGAEPTEDSIPINEVWTGQAWFTGNYRFTVNAKAGAQFNFGITVVGK